MPHYPNGKELVLKTNDVIKGTIGSSPMCGGVVNNLNDTQVWRIFLARKYIQRE